MSTTRFLLGFGIGVGLGMLLAPVSGEEARHSVAEKTRDLIEIPQRKVQEKVNQAAETAKEKAGDIGGKVGREAAEAAVQAVREDVLGKDRSA
jgi:gas vesicle protein